MSARQPEPERLTPARLEVIRARADAATPGPWHSEAAKDAFVDQVWAGKGTDALRALARVSGPNPNDASFIAHAREDIPALLAQIDRLRTQVRFLLEQVRRKDAESGAGNRALAGFLAEPTPCDLPNDCDGYEPCDRHEREDEHAEGEHAFCGDECAEGGEQ